MHGASWLGRSTPVGRRRRRSRRERDATAPRDGGSALSRNGAATRAPPGDRATGRPTGPGSRRGPAARCPPARRPAPAGSSPAGASPCQACRGVYGALVAEDPRTAPDTSRGDAAPSSDEGRRVGVVDLGTNSTRLLVAEVHDGRVSELERRTTVTRLGEGVEATGKLSDAAVARVCEALAVYREVLDRLGADEIVAVATSAIRDAENGPAFRDEIRDRFGIDARTISGDEEARLTFLGATSDRQAGAETLVIDIGGGSTEYVTGRAGSDPGFHVSTRMGPVRHTERHLKSDPPTADEMASLAEDVRAIVTQQVLADVRERVTGLHPDRAPSIVAGAVILLESMRSFDLDEIEVSEADILHGAALAADDGIARAP